MKNITGIPVVHWVINKLICTEQRFMMLSIIALIRLDIFNIPSIFMEIYCDREVT